MFKTNVGGTDRILSIVAGLALLAAYSLHPDAFWRSLFLLGVVPLATGVLGTCPAHSIFRLNTYPVKN